MNILEFLDEMIQVSHPSLARQILITIPLLGPLLCTFVFLYMKQYQRLTISITVSVIVTVFMTLNGHHFFEEYRFHKKYGRE